MKVYRDLVEDGVLVSKEIFDIAECTYTGKDMGERSITATIYFATPIDFQIGDYIKLPMQNLIRSTSGVNGSIASGSGEVEKFYIYTMPTMKKVARAMENGKAFEHTVTFYPAQYELSCVQMRDLGNSLSADEIIYTGFDSVSFNGGAKELMDRIMMVLKEAYHDSEGNPLWSYEISDSVNEEKNLALERFPISFSGNTVMDALLELNNKETINTTFFINNRKIYVGFKRPYFCRVTDGMSIDTNPSSQLFTFQYGKTSDKGVALQYGGLYDITKSVGKEVPITKLFAYGASRNLNRYYCSDRVKGGRYVNRLMLPSFDTDGKTDFIISEDALQRYGVREGTKQFEEIYPSIRYATYGDIRQVKYCIKVKASGVKDENIDSPSYPIARIQCYKIVEGEITGVNKLVEAAPPDDLAVYIHAMDKVVKVVLYGGATDAEAIAKQKQHDTKVPTYTSGGSDYIPGACFIVHDRGFDEAGTVYENANRSAWFTSIDNLSGFTEKQKEEIKLNQINYTDTFWLTDLYIFNSYDQSYFSRDGYSAWSWARLNSKYTSSQGHIASDSVVVNEIVHVEPITLADTSMTAAGIDKPQQTFDIYLRDLGFTINEQNDFGEMVFILNGTVKVSILDGLLAGQEFEISGSINSTSPSCICAFNDDGTRNEAFFAEPDYTQDGANPQTPYDAFNKGAIWRVRLNRTNVDDPDYSNLNLAMPTKEINAKSGDHLVLLDLFMPDIYIHAAENRLLREARKYLEANDNGSISYSVNFDKVRLQQIPNYAMQLREGLNLRVVDEDLNIKTENNGRYIADYRTNPIYSQRELADGKNSDWVSTVAPIDFTRSKHYTIELSIFNSSEFDINDFKFALFKTKNDNNTSFEPEYSVEQTEKGMDIILTIKFQLPDNFDDGQLYYPSAYLCKLKSWYNIVDMYLISVFERDYAENEEVLNYADFTIDSLTVKITDNSGNNEPIREITATLSEQTNATAWATLMNKVATTAKEGEQNKKALEEVVNTARRNYHALLSLKDSIFDPDGSCDQVFLQVMMQQVGADSMNYQLDNTRSGLSSDGQPVLFNCSCERGSDGYYHFKVYNDDTLRHYVYTQGSQAGNWEIPVRATGFDVQLNGTESYFVCLKCPKNDTVGQWICSTKQYAVNDPEDDTCWFFNWAILTVDSGGVYTLMETRGNAYMYGDNLVCGKISTLAGNSYFDLTHGNFVLGDGTGHALSYINGVLTISGSKGDAEETLEKLGILQEDVETAQSTAKALASSVATINGDIDELQKQIDGEVNSWFMEGEPANNYRPANEWTDQTLKDRHLGDTYTNILPADVDLSTLDSNGTLQWVEQGYLQVGSAAFGKTFAEQRQGATNFCRTKCIMQLANTATKITITPKDIPSGCTLSVLFAYYNAEKKYYVNDSWKYNSDNSSIAYTVPAYGDAFGGTQVYYFSILFISLSNGKYLSITPSNIASIESDVVFANPEAGKSWRWCNYDDEDNTTFHWHPIADSDAVKALQEAAKAQSTADGKSTTFVVEPTNYNIGDLWILAADRTLNGTTYKQGTILTANAASATFVESHWSEDVKYIDEDKARQQAQQALDGLIVGGTNLIPAVGFSSSDSHQTITKLQEELYSQGVYQVTKKTSDTPPASSYNITQYVKAGKTYVASVYIRCDTAPSGTSLTKWGLIRFYGKNASGVNVTYADGLIDAEPKVGQWYQRQVVYTIPSDFDASKETIKIFCYAPSAAGVVSSMSCIKLEEGNKATPTYNMPISSIAQWAEESLQQLSDMSNDGILTPQEKKNVSNEWSEIQGMYSVNDNNVTSLFGSSKPTEWTEYNTKYSNLSTYITSLNLGSGSNTTITKTTFQTKFSEYYNADVNLQKAIAKKSAELEVAAMEIGGRNLLRNSATFTHVAGSTDNFAYKTLTPTVGLQPNTNYVFSVDKSEMTAGSDTAFTVYLFSGDIKTGRNKLTIPISSTRQSVSFKTTAAVTDTDVVLIYAGQQGTTAGKAIKLTNIKLEQGTKATDWTPAPEDVDAKVSALDYLKEALENDTDVTGGIVATTSIQLRDKVGNDYVVNAGLSGVKDDNILLWGGGDYTDAVTAKNNTTTYNKVDNTPITTLLKKDGTGKIGIFKISDTQAVVDVPNQGKVIIDASTTNGGIRVLNSSGKINAALLPSSISSYKPKEDVNNTIGGSKTHSGISSSSNNVASASVTLNLGSNTTYPSTTASEEVLDTYTKRITYTLECTSVTASQVTISGSVNRIYSSSSQPTFDASNVTVKCSLRVNGTEVKSGSAVKNFTAGASSTGSSNNNVTFSNTITLSGSTKPTLNGGTNTVTMVVTVTLASSQYAGKLSAINLKVTGGQTTINYAHTTKTAYIYQPMTIIGNDGLVSLVGHKTYFMVDNSGSTQKIFAKGLSQTKGTAGSGELYVSDSFITAFKDFLEYMKTWVESVRAIGSNSTTATNMQNKIQDVYDKLTDTSLIANS